MGTKPLPTFKHTSVGSKTHKARTATAHVSYIMRSDAMTKFQAENMPDGGRGTRVFFDKLWEKAGMPENARICDKLMIALPVELSQEQRYEAVQSFMHELGKGRVAWCAAHHDAGEDAHNPHAHIVFKDADIDTGRKVIGTTTSSRDVREAEEHGWKVPPRTTTADMRKLWCAHLNGCMERAGLDIRYDPRTLKEQGIEREPEIHIGPKAQALDEKGYEFQSHDQIRGERSIPYTLFDEASRALHNARIKEANGQKEKVNGEARVSGDRARPPSPEAIEQRTLREGQKEVRKEMYAGQQRDRDALRRAQDEQKREHQKWAKQLYAAARQQAFDTIKEQYAGRWEEVRAIGDLKEREKAARTLKAEEKKSYAAEATRQVDGRRPEKDTAWKAMMAGQEQERLDLLGLHRKENSALSRQHIAERRGVHEKWRAIYLGRRTDALDVRLTTRQGMAAQQKAAVDTIKLHNKAGRDGAEKNGVILAANPREAARAYFETARREAAKHEAIRAQLLEQRTKNLERAGIAQDSRTWPAERQRTNGRTARNGNAGASPRASLLPGIHVARDSRFEKVQERMRDIDPQQQIRQAAAAGRALTSDERANASPEMKERLAREDKKSQERSSFFTGGNSRGQDRGKDGRSGGGRGR